MQSFYRKIVEELSTSKETTKNGSVVTHIESISLPKKTNRVEFFWENAAFFRYSGVNATNAANLQAKRR